MDKTLELTFIGVDSWSRPVYKDQNECLWKDVELTSTELDEGDEVDKSILCTSTGNAFNGEPNTHMSSIEKYQDYKVNLIFKEEPISEEQRFKYMMLGRLKSDCNAHLYPYNNSTITDINGHIAYMKKLWNELKIKPEWLSFEQIEQYERQMLETHKEDALS